MGETSDSSKNPNENKTVSFADLVKEQWGIGTGRCKLVPVTKGFFIIKLISKEDKERVWHGDSWTVQQQTLRVFNFYPNFDPERQNTSCASVWVSFPGLYIELWTKRILLSIAKILGKPIAIDQKTLDHDVGNYANVLIDIDFAKPIPKRIRLKANSNEFWQYVEVQDLENIKFCTHYKFIGHKFENCLAARKLLGGSKSSNVSQKPQKDDKEVNNPNKKYAWREVRGKNNVNGNGSNADKGIHSEVIVSHENYAENVNNIVAKEGIQSVGASTTQTDQGVGFSSHQEKELAEDKQLEDELNSSFVEYREAQLKLIRCKNAIATKKDIAARKNYVHAVHEVVPSDSVQSNSEITSKQTHSRTNVESGLVMQKQTFVPNKNYESVSKQNLVLETQQQFVYKENSEIMSVNCHTQALNISPGLNTNPGSVPNSVLETYSKPESVNKNKHAKQAENQAVTNSEANSKQESSKEDWKTVKGKNSPTKGTPFKFKSFETPYVDALFQSELVVNNKYGALASELGLANDSSDKSIPALINEIKLLSDQLAAAGEIVSDRELVVITLKALNSEYIPFATSMRHRNPPITSIDLHNNLLSEETMVSERLKAHKQDLEAKAFVANNYRNTYKGSSSRGNYRGRHSNASGGYGGRYPNPAIFSRNNYDRGTSFF
ncbi:uncharacterized protein LOC113342256 [Papaver somniferum]|uniref:uncharacterized protein LOC113342256 n=1 Tax=Papaver somniferum TaxID=3469 RepID=UPI000E6F9463|nr:uncharacterized protein LOC113342256 [Papaver somniferum]